MRRGLALVLLAVAGVALSYLVAVEAAVGRLPPTPLERGLEARDELVVSRGLASTLPDLRAAPEPPTLVVLVTPRSLPDAEREALREYVEEGGELWVVSPEPSARALWRDDNLKAVAFRGFLYASDGLQPNLTLTGDRSLHGLGFLALDLAGEYEPVLTTDHQTFRDTNGNRRLDVGEPGGPFVAGAQRQVGEGRVVVIGAEDASLLPDALSTGLSLGLPAGAVLIVDADAAGAWTAPGRAVLGVASLPTGSLVAALVLLVAAAALLLLAFPRGASGRDDDAPAFRLASAYAERLRERGRPEDVTILRSLEGDTAP